MWAAVIVLFSSLALPCGAVGHWTAGTQTGDLWIEKRRDSNHSPRIIYNACHYLPQTMDKSNIHYHHGTCFYFSMRERKTIPDAKKFCQTIGGHLVKISSKSRNDYILQELRKVHTRHTYWIGLGQDLKWYDKTPLVYNNLDTPLTTIMKRGPYEGFAISAHTGKWRKVRFDHKRKTYTERKRFICEYGRIHKSGGSSSGSFGKIAGPMKTSHKTPNVPGCPKNLPASSHQNVFGDSCFMFEKTARKSRPEAEQVCKRLGGTLVMIKSERVQEFIKAEIPQIQSVFWIGLQLDEKIMDYNFNIGNIGDYSRRSISSSEYSESVDGDVATRNTDSVGRNSGSGSFEKFDNLEDIASSDQDVYKRSESSDESSDESESENTEEIDDVKGSGRRAGSGKSKGSGSRNRSRSRQRGDGRHTSGSTNRSKNHNNSNNIGTSSKSKSHGHTTTHKEKVRYLYKWQDGTPMTYSNFPHGPPSQDLTRRCVYMDSRFGLWHSSPCDASWLSHLHYICQFARTMTTPTITTSTTTRKPTTTTTTATTTTTTTTTTTQPTTTTTTTTERPTTTTTTTRQPTTTTTTTQPTTTTTTSTTERPTTTTGSPTTTTILPTRKVIHFFHPAIIVPTSKIISIVRPD